jgi:hypothetical protein
MKPVASCTEWFNTHLINDTYFAQSACYCAQYERKNDLVSALHIQQGLTVDDTRI